MAQDSTDTAAKATFAENLKNLLALQRTDSYTDDIDTGKNVKYLVKSNASNISSVRAGPIKATAIYNSED